MDRKTLVVRVSPDLAQHLKSPGTREARALAFREAVDRAGGTLAPIDPQSGPHYLDVSLPAAGDADTLGRMLREIDGVDSAFVKPDVELPGSI